MKMYFQSCIPGRQLKANSTCVYVLQCYKVILTISEELCRSAFKRIRAQTTVWQESKNRKLV